MSEITSLDREEAMARLKELVLDHLGIPRPGASKHLQQLQDQLLPSFMETARYAWLAASPMQLTLTPNDPIYQYFTALSNRTPEIGTLNSILEELGVHDLLRDLADSSDVAALGSLPLDPYEERLLRAVGHPKPDTAVLEYLRHAAKEPSLLASPSQKVEEAARVRVTLNTHGNITVVVDQPSAPPPPVPPAPQAPPGVVAPAPEKPIRRRLFSGIGKLFSSFVLLSGNGILIPTVMIGSLTALPVLGSLAAGIAAVAEGIGHLRREGA